MSSDFPASSLQSSPSTPLAGRADLAIHTFGRFNKELVESMRSVTEMAERGPSNVLLRVGAAMIMVALSFKVQVAGFQIANLQPTEFVTVLIIAAAVLVCASLLRLYQYRCQQEVNRRMREEGVKLIHDAFNAGVTLAQTEASDSPPGDL